MTGMSIRKTEDLCFVKGRPRALILFHGFSDEPETLRPLAEYLFQHLDADVYVPLLSGHGNTLADLEKVHFKEWITQAEKLIKQLKETYARIDVAGFSMGSFLALNARLEIPSIQKAVIIAPPFVFPSGRSSALFFLPVIRLLKKYKRKRLDEQGGNRHIYEKKQRLIYLPRFKKEPLKSIEEFNHLRKKVKKRLKKIDFPVLAIFALDDRVAVIRNRILLSRFFKHNYYRSVTVVRSGHMIPVDYDRFILFDEIKQFLQDNEGRYHG